MKTLQLFLLNAFIALFTFAVVKLLEGYYATCLLNYEFHNTQTACGLTTLEFLQLIGTLLLGIIIINWISIKKSKNNVEYIIISFPQIFLIAFLISGLINFIKY